MLKTRLWLMLPALFVLLMVLFYPFRFVFEFNPDEGIELITGLLHARGHELYSEIYSDHPPFFTLMLSALFQGTGYSVNSARLLVLLLSTILIFASVIYLLVLWGPPHALAGWLVIVLLPIYLRLSVSAMIGLPAITFALVSLLCLSLWHKDRKVHWLWFSSFAMCLSVMTKLFTLFLAPTFVVGILLASRPKGKETGIVDAIRPAALWLGGFLLLVGSMLLSFVGASQSIQLIRIHITALEVPQYMQRASELNINYYLADSWAILLAGVAGSVLSIRRSSWTDLYLVAWALIAYAALSVLVPVWDHHQLLVTVPAGILAAIFLGETASRCWRTLGPRSAGRPRYGLTILMLAFGGFVISSRIPSVLSELQSTLPNLNMTIRPQDERDYEVLAVMWDRADRTDLVLTDRPMFAFRLEKPVPPETALFSEKRVRTESLTGAQILDLIRSQKPGQVLFTRFRLQGVDSYLGEVYEPAYTYRLYRLYLHPELRSP